MEKLYYSISEVAEIFDVAPTLIRFWEKEFEQIKPRRNSKGNRQFTNNDIETFRVIYHLVKVRKLTLEGAKQELKGNMTQIAKEIRVINKLTKIKQELSDIKRELNENFRSSKGD